ncbi:anaphase-promoting complex subunit 15B-like [Artemia franciscana]|uniref:anaphase-promoting complex subunit 15B-like n=1 Tax=Artemia franciscana TaxID=6661 RepID=UPI0032DB91CF
MSFIEPEFRSTLLQDIDKSFVTFDDSVLASLEQEHEKSLSVIANKDIDLLPIGKTTKEPNDYDESEFDLEDEAHDDDESDSREVEDDELDIDTSFASSAGATVGT